MLSSSVRLASCCLAPKRVVLDPDAACKHPLHVRGGLDQTMVEVPLAFPGTVIEELHNQVHQLIRSVREALGDIDQLEL